MRSSAMSRQDAGPPLVRLVVGQPHQLIGDALARELEAARFQVVARCEHPEDLERCLRTHRPDIGLVDTELAGGGDVGALLRAARRARAGGRLVLLAAAVDAGLARETLELEVDGVVLKCASGGDVVAALTRVQAGDAVFPAGWIAAARRPAEAVLSARQAEVLDLLAQGLPNEAIAARLFIPRNTVKFHVAAIYQRLGVCNRVQAAHALGHLRAAG